MKTLIGSATSAGLKNFSSDSLKNSADRNTVNFVVQLWSTNCFYML
jgi:hypothetical protein